MAVWDGLGWMILKVFFNRDDSVGGGTQPRPWVMTLLLGLQRKGKRQGFTGRVELWSSWEQGAAAH